MQTFNTKGKVNCAYIVPVTRMFTWSMRPNETLYSTRCSSKLFVSVIPTMLLESLSTGDTEAGFSCAVAQRPLHFLHSNDQEAVKLPPRQNSRTSTTLKKETNSGY